MAFTAQQITSHLDAMAKAGATDAQMRAEMVKYDVSPSQVAAAYGVPTQDIQSRYDAAITPAQITTRLDQMAAGGANDAALRAEMDKYAVTPTQVASAYGVPTQSIQTRYDAAAPASSTANPATTVTKQDTPTANTVPTVTNKDTPFAFADAYNVFASQGGGDTQANRDQAAAYLRSLGVSDRDINFAYQAYQRDRANEGQFAKSAAELAALNERFSQLNQNTQTLQSQFRQADEANKQLQAQLAELQKAYDTLRRRPTDSGGGLTGGGGVVDDGSTFNPGGGFLGTGGVVYGPDGTAYSSPAAAIAAGVTNFSYQRPGSGLISGADTLNNQFLQFARNTGNANPGADIFNQDQQLFNLGAPKVALPAGVARPFIR
jgi:hypothetical protein